MERSPLIGSGVATTIAAPVVPLPALTAQRLQDPPLLTEAEFVDPQGRQRWLQARLRLWRRDGRGWVPRASARAALAETLKLVTAFTAAHSITLGLAAAGVIPPAGAVVESLIALTVLLAALDNLRPFVPGPRWAMVAVCGLVHGVGFAGPLTDLGLRGRELLVPLLGFNLGVELGQLAAVALLLPPALWLRGRPAYRRWIVPGGSSAIAALAALWLAERSLALQLLP